MRAVAAGRGRASRSMKLIGSATAGAAGHATAASAAHTPTASVRIAFIDFETSWVATCRLGPGWTAIIMCRGWKRNVADREGTDHGAQWKFGRDGDGSSH